RASKIAAPWRSRTRATPRPHSAASTTPARRPPSSPSLARPSTANSEPAVQAPRKARVHMSDTPPTSRIPGFYEKSIAERLERIADTGLLSEASRAFFDAGGGLCSTVADKMSENVIGAYGLPFSLGLNFRLNHRDVLVPMAV